MKRSVFWFALAGTVGFVVDASVLSIALHLGAGYFAGRAVSFLCAVWATWQINRRLTFRGQHRESAWKEWWRYLVAMSAGGAVNYAAYSAAVLCMPASRASPVIAVAIGSLAGMGVNYAGARLWVFRPSTRKATRDSC